MRKLRRNVKEKIIKTAVSGSIDHLISEAEKRFPSNKELSKRYLKMAWELVKKTKVRLTKDQKLRFCRKCFILWVPGKTVRISFDSKNDFFVFSCASCGYKRKNKR
jgi:ribonuclease P protein subunit RPR2